MRNVTPRLRRALAGAALAVGFSVGAQALEPKAPGETWTADRLEREFVAEFGADVAQCYGDYAFAAGPDAPQRREAASPRWKRAIVALDASGSMRAKAGGREKMAAAKEAVAEFLARAPKDAEVGLVAFGHKGSNDDSGKAQSCAGVDVLIEPGRGDAGAAAETMRAIDAVGWTPLGAAIRLAGERLAPADEPGEQVVFVVSDGVETCGGDPVAAAAALRESDAKAIVNVIGFDLKNEEREALAAVAEAGGGGFSAAKDAAEIRARLLDEASAKTGAAVFEGEAGRTVALNDAKAVRTAATATACVTRRSAEEVARFTRVGAELRRRGRADAATVDEVARRLKARERARLDAVEAFGAQVKAEAERANAPTEAARERNRKRSDD